MANQDSRTEILAKNNLGGWWFDSENCLYNAIEISLAKRLVAAYEAAGFEASWAPDEGKAWLYVTPKSE